ncbi:MAG: DUF4270 family protein [Muribaculaceae bacterium]|nr:DUF4270 family protein [Muribaculaceae bacterium]MBR3102006.1 DUF4270 family protein [Muribaculaceae bacterium]
MKKTLYVLFALSLIAGAYSCADENIGMSIADTKYFYMEDSSFSITGHSVENPRLQSRTSMQLLGVIKSDGYGTLRSDVVTQFMPVQLIDTVHTNAASIDSCKLKLRIPASSGGFTGDSLATMRLNVYRLKKQLPSPIFSDFDPTEYFDESDLLGSTAYSPRSAQLQSTTSDGYTTYYFRDIYVPMPVELAREIFNEYKNNPSTMNDPTSFAKFFPGVYIANSYGSGRVMNFTNTELVSYFHRTYKTSAGADSIVNTSQTYLGASPEVVSNNIIRLDVEQAVKDMVAAGDAIVMAPAGYEVRLTFPIQEIIDRYKNNSEGDVSVINSLQMELPVELLPTQYGINPPAYLLMVKTSKKDQFIAGDSLTNNKDSFYATYNKSTRKYVFSGMRDYILNIINKQGGIASAEDKDLTLTPVDVTTYTSSSSYSYYYSTTPTTTVTKIAPQVSVPAIAKILLDKARIKITYSRQALY